MISSISGASYSSMMGGMNRMQRPDPSQMAEDLFSKIDTSGKGYIEKSDLASALENVSSGNVTNVDEVFASLDGDSDGKITQDEMASSLQKQMEALESQFQGMRMQGGMSQMGGMMPPPPPPEGDEGFTQEELSAQLEEIGDTDSARSDLISSIVNNFEAADTDGDGKVTFKEAMDYKESTQSASSDSTTEDSTSSASVAESSSTEGSSSQVLFQIMRLMEAYGLGRQETGQSLSQSA
ncbi:MAG: EF-hand domain-containing protein [Pseudomonadota bacterium]